ncbi:MULTISPECIES: efflux RND transporter periplasmic adaptor subunit [Lichenihabitans]|uniref:efflux RND transporter periplasmic adaptor subunit n=1 Tax=Lichenihabitans TaxID=2723776 RepID=UPI0010369D4B|nr:MULTISPECIES: HlyD family secretion protein [Lichenihabitans]UDL93963.1 HlyD family secretion protein [Lichenihabitans sp. PAMC28606]
MSAFVSVLGRFLVTMVAVVAAVVVGWHLWVYYMDAPWTRDGRVRADIVAIAPDVSGLVTDVLVKDNQAVQKGDILFRIDRQRFSLALDQADAVVAGRKAALDIATADLGRYKQLSDNVVSREKLEQSSATQQQAVASYQQAIADRNIAKLNLDRSDVKASVPGTITNMDLQPGEYVSAGKGVMALVDKDTLHVEGYFEETKLPMIRVGDPVSVRILGEATRLTGHVESIAGGIEDRERSSGSNLLANVNPSFTWVRLAQRVPVRVKLDDVPPDVQLLAGRTATVVVNPGQPQPELAWLPSFLTGRAE